MLCIIEVFQWLFVCITRNFLSYTSNCLNILFLDAINIKYKDPKNICPSRSENSKLLAFLSRKLHLINSRKTSIFIVLIKCFSSCSKQMSVLIVVDILAFFVIIVVLYSINYHGMSS